MLITVVYLKLVFTLAKSIAFLLFWRFTPLFVYRQLIGDVHATMVQILFPATSGHINLYNKP